MSGLLDLVDKLHEAGVVSTAQRRRVQIHATYWLLRRRGVGEMDAKNAVSDAYTVQLSTVEAYVYPEHKYDSLVPNAKLPPHESIGGNVQESSAV